MSYLETGWVRYQQGLEFHPSTIGKSFESFEEYASWIVEVLLKADYEQFKIKQQEALSKVSSAVKRALNRSLEVERNKK